MGFRALRRFGMSGGDSHSGNMYHEGRRALMAPIKLFRAGLLLMVAALIGECLYVTLGANYFAVVPGQCYRSAQPDASFTRELVNNRGIRTIVNLRGDNTGKDWCDGEHA